MTNIDFNRTMVNTTQDTLSPDYLSAVAHSLVQVVGVLGNTLVIHSICSPTSHLNNTHYNLVVYLAVCDLLHLELSFGDASTFFHQIRHSFAPLLCVKYGPKCKQCILQLEGTLWSSLRSSVTGLLYIL